jgi:hypothetical protein
MSESAAIIKSFFVPSCATLLAAHTLQADGAEDKALLGSNLSADSGAKTRLGVGFELSPSRKTINWDWHQQRKIPGVWGQSPQANVAPFLSTRFVRAAHSQIPHFRRIHVSALNFCKSLFR